MFNRPLNISSFDRAILHIDGDAFFASCEQSRDPALRGRPVITGKERGIASSMSYEAKARGITRGMRLYEIKKLCPDAVILPSDYETYSLLSKRFYDIVRRYTSEVEEYGIDECFADITGLRRCLRLSYPQIAEKLKNDIDRELGFTFSVGLAPNKVMAKVGSKWAKPSGLTIIPAKKIHLFLQSLAIEKIWGVGPQTSAYLNKLGIRTALDYAVKSEAWVRTHLTKPHYEIWQELNGKYILELNLEPKTSYASIQKVKTFTPPSSDRAFVFSQLSKNIENACLKARRYQLCAKTGVIFLKTQDFQSEGLEIVFSRPTTFPNEVIDTIEPAFNQLFNHKKLYRSTGIILLKLETEQTNQLDLFGGHLKIEKMSRLFAGIDKMRLKYGKHTICLGSSFTANVFGQHLSERGDVPERKQKLLPGETVRKRLAIPMFLGEVN
jgi:nucleotidyltransferase/DNA polymerase involved in DNA repair